MIKNEDPNSSPEGQSIFRSARRASVCLGSFSLRVGTLGVLVALCGGFAGCQPKSPHGDALQGVVEFDERDLGFEIGGRLTSVKARRGDVVRPGDEIATLDDTIERTSKEGRQAEVSAAKAAVSLVRAGSRPEEVRAAQAQLRAMQANEARLTRNVAREKKLFSEGAIPAASVDDLESQLQAATAERQSLEHRLRELENGARREEIDRAEAQAEVAGQQTKLSDERLNRYTLRAVEEGVVLDVHAERGEIVNAGTPVFTVANTKHPYADVFIRQQDLADLGVGTPAHVVVDASPAPFAAVVEDISRKTEFTPRYLFSERERSQLVVRVRMRIDDPKQALHAGVPAFVTVDRAAPSAVSNGSTP